VCSSSSRIAIIANLFKLGKALREYVYGQVAKGETDKKRLVVSGLTHLKRLEKQATK